MGQSSFHLSRNCQKCDKSRTSRKQPIEKNNFVFHLTCTAYYHIAWDRMLAHTHISDIVKRLSLRVGKVAIPSRQMRSYSRVQTALVLTLRYHRLRLMIPQSQVSFPVVKFIHRSSPDLNRVGLVEFGIQCHCGGEQCMLQVSLRKREE